MLPGLVEKEVTHEACVADLSPTRSPVGIDGRWHTLQAQRTQALVQRTPAWYAFRKGRMTGSKFSSLFFTDTEVEYEELHARIFANGPPEKFDAASLARMRWGTTHEDHAAAEMLSYFPQLVGFEASILAHPTVPWMAASPDGTVAVVDQDRGTYHRVNVEIKCPSPKKGKWKNVSCPMYYYMGQLHAEMACTATRGTLFVVWTPKRCKVWYVPFNKQYHDDLVDWTTQFKEKRCTFKQFLFRKRHMEQFSKALAKAAIPLHPRGGFESGYTMATFKLG